MATVLVPGEHTATIPITGSHDGTAQTRAAWSQSVAGYYAAAYPHLDASARACVAHHASVASKACQASEGYNTGAPCPTPWPEELHYGGFTETDSLVGWETGWGVPSLPLQVSGYTVRCAQPTLLLSPMTFQGVVARSPSWIAAAESVLPTGQEWRATSTVAVSSITATATVRVGVVVGDDPIAVDVIRRSDGGADLWISPGECPGTVAGSLIAFSGGETVDVAWDEILTDQVMWTCVATNSDTDLGYLPGAIPGGGVQQTLALIGVTEVNATFTGTVTYSDVSIFGVPPLHAAQRRGGTDAHAAHARGADTRQSRLLARGPL